MTAEQFGTFLWFIAGLLAGGVTIVFLALASAIARDTFTRQPVPPSATRVIDRIWSDDLQVWTELDIHPPDS